MSLSFLEEARARRDWMVEQRRDFHRHPELAFQEVRTAGVVARRLSDLGLEVQAGIGKTGVVAVLEGAADGPTVLVRADMDALPILEENAADYVSQNAGVMHACGHDAHTTIGLTVAEMLAARRDQIRGRVKFIFQPAEEIGQGARAMIADGALSDPRPDLSIGLHVWNDLEVGKVAVMSGPSMAAADEFIIRIRGYGGHAAQPGQSRDPILAAAQIVSGLQAIVSRNVNPLDTAVLSVTTIHGGDAFNVIPELVEMKGTIRTFRKDVREMVHRRARAIIEGVAASFDCTGEFELTEMTLAVNNDSAIAEHIAALVEEQVGPQNLLRDLRTMGSEDMAYFMDDIPGCYFFVGSRNESRNLKYPHHNPRFDIDEEAMVIGASLLAKAAASYLIPG